MQPFVAVGMIEMPVRVDQMRHGAGTKLGGRLGDLRTPHADPCIDEDLSLRTRKNGNVASRAFKNADAVSQRMGDDRSCGCAVLDQADNAPRLAEGLPWHE